MDCLEIWSKDSQDTHLNMCWYIVYGCNTSNGTFFFCEDMHKGLPYPLTIKRKEWKKLRFWWIVSFREGNFLL